MITAYTEKNKWKLGLRLVFNFNRFAPYSKLELNTEKEGFMAYTAPEDAQRPRAVYAINPDIRGI